MVRIEQRTIKLDQLTFLCRPDLKDDKLNTHVDLQQLSRSDDPDDMMSNATPEQRTELLKIMLHRPALKQDEERSAIELIADKLGLLPETSKRIMQDGALTEYAPWIGQEFAQWAKGNALSQTLAELRKQAKRPYEDKSSSSSKKSY